MTLYKPFDSNVELLGQSFLAILDAIKVWPTMYQMALDILKTHHINEIEPTTWYPHQIVLDVFKDIGIRLGGAVLYRIGKKVPENAIFPPQIDSMEAALRSIDIAYHLNHRGGEIGSYAVIELRPQKVSLVCHNPYPCDFDGGLIDCIARRFLPPAHSITISHSSAPCRKNGKDVCTYVVQWRKK